MDNLKSFRMLQRTDEASPWKRMWTFLDKQIHQQKNQKMLNAILDTIGQYQYQQYQNQYNNKANRGNIDIFGENLRWVNQASKWCQISLQR